MVQPRVGGGLTLSRPLGFDPKSHYNDAPPGRSPVRGFVCAQVPMRSEDISEDDDVVLEAAPPVPELDEADSQQITLRIRRR